MYPPSPSLFHSSHLSHIFHSLSFPNPHLYLFIFIHCFCLSALHLSHNSLPIYPSLFLIYPLFPIYPLFHLHLSHNSLPIYPSSFLMYPLFCFPLHYIHIYLLIHSNLSLIFIHCSCLPLHYIFPIILFPSIPVFSNLSMFLLSLHLSPFPLHLSCSFLIYVSTSIFNLSLHLFYFHSRGLFQISSRVSVLFPSTSFLIPLPSIPVSSNLSLHLFYFHICLFHMSQLSTVPASLHYIFPIILFPSIPVFSNLSTVSASLHYIFPIILSHLSQSFLMYVSTSLLIYLFICSISTFHHLSTSFASLHYIFPIILFPSIPVFSNVCIHCFCLSAFGVSCLSHNSSSHLSQSFLMYVSTSLSNLSLHLLYFHMPCSLSKCSQLSTVLSLSLHLFRSNGSLFSFKCSLSCLSLGSSLFSSHLSQSVSTFSISNACISSYPVLFPLCINLPISLPIYPVLFYFHSSPSISSCSISTLCPVSFHSIHCSASLHYIFPIILFPSVPVFSLILFQSISNVLFPSTFLFSNLSLHLFLFPHAMFSTSFLFSKWVCSISSLGYIFSISLPIYPSLFYFHSNLAVLFSTLHILFYFHSQGIHCSVLHLSHLSIFPSLFSNMSQLSTVSASLHYIFPIILFPSIPVFSNSMYPLIYLFISIPHVLFPSHLLLIFPHLFPSIPVLFPHLLCPSFYFNAMSPVLIIHCFCLCSLHLSHNSLPIYPILPFITFPIILFPSIPVFSNVVSTSLLIYLFICSISTFSSRCLSYPLFLSSLHYLFFSSNSLPIIPLLFLILFILFLPLCITFLFHNSLPIYPNVSVIHCFCLSTLSFPVLFPSIPVFSNFHSLLIYLFIFIHCFCLFIFIFPLFYSHLSQFFSNLCIHISFPSISSSVLFPHAMSLQGSTVSASSIHSHVLFPSIPVFLFPLSFNLSPSVLFPLSFPSLACSIPSILFFSNVCIHLFLIYLFIFIHCFLLSVLFHLSHNSLPIYPSSFLIYPLFLSSLHYIFSIFSSHLSQSFLMYVSTSLLIYLFICSISTSMSLPVSQFHIFP
ncbi:unnamed protein product [Acanthosepion pharaonis]|uniref:Uncharacterized protein n=1 Tax=Acanthosepion pharaonis TaxID=158019 RepID=A0A812C3N9_ACAPH|nr:unnamed protein product [Sepia pharaonis]